MNEKLSKHLQSSSNSSQTINYLGYSLFSRFCHNHNRSINIKHKNIRISPYNIKSTRKIEPESRTGYIYVILAFSNYVR